MLKITEVNLIDKTFLIFVFSLLLGEKKSFVLKTVLFPLIIYQKQFLLNCNNKPKYLLCITKTG
jgi:hypothetical protein